jgi:hypothetical protein
VILFSQHDHDSDYFSRISIKAESYVLLLIQSAGDECKSPNSTCTYILDDDFHEQTHLPVNE